MKRILALSVIGGLALTGLLAAPAHAKTCGTLTKKEASEALGFKVVKTKELSEGDVEGCDYITKKRFPALQSPMKLTISVQPLTVATEDVLRRLEADDDSEPVEGLGDKAFYTGGNDLVAVVGDQVFQVEVTNVKWQGDELDTYIREPELAAMQQLVEQAS